MEIYVIGIIIIVLLGGWILNDEKETKQVIIPKEKPMTKITSESYERISYLTELTNKMLEEVHEQVEEMIKLGASVHYGGGATRISIFDDKIKKVEINCRLSLSSEFDKKNKEEPK